MKKKILNNLKHPQQKDSLACWNILQIMSEFVHGHQQLCQLEPSISIFGSARTPEDHPYYRSAEETAFLLSQAGFSVVTGGGPGIMEAANKGGANGKSVTVGLNISLPHLEPPNRYQELAIYFQHFFSRKSMFVQYASAFICFPGGYGTLDELSEILTLVQTQKSRRIPIILMHSEYWEGLLTWFKDKLLREGMIREEDLDLMEVVDHPQEVLSAIFKFYQKRGIEMTMEEKQIMSNL